MGKVKIAQTFARAGLHMGNPAVGRILQEKPAPPLSQKDTRTSPGRAVNLKYSNHLWLVDLTTIPIGGGFWCSWFPGIVTGVELLYLCLASSSAKVRR
jgi:hypothetical protein